MRDSPQNVTYEELENFCTKHFGPPRTTGGSHAVFEMPWKGDPRVNIQKKKGGAKPYQVAQVLDAYDQKLVYDKMAKEAGNG